MMGTEEIPKPEKQLYESDEKKASALSLWARLTEDESVIQEVEKGIYSEKFEEMLRAMKEGTREIVGGPSLNDARELDELLTFIEEKRAP